MMSATTDNIDGEPQKVVNITTFGAGNQAWRKCLNPGTTIEEYQNPENVLLKVIDYFQWLENNPLNDTRLVSFEGDSKLELIPKPRAATLQGLCIHLGISRDTWGRWRRGNRPDLQGIIAFAEDYMFDSKFAHAAAGLMNPTVIMRDLGLADRSEISGPNGGPIQTEELNRDADDFASAMGRLATSFIEGSAEPVSRSSGDPDVEVGRLVGEAESDSASGGMVDLDDLGGPGVWEDSIRG